MQKTRTIHNLLKLLHGGSIYLERGAGKRSGERVKGAGNKKRSGLLKKERVKGAGSG